ncbi:hypothetical protein FHR83_005649 [Actinoplanes campanulatus]|uniref:Uncharacterized protein n=1 Tax=Actinoplanes campanulatus TaxID=113559 RepID=A0A7W5ALG3_9ACTN|nr:hypothetical protein [Actinoplanes campanulatus]MBB3097964.1 hypothetical protein [Actinoplanes campanulatus]GGN31637.1 hypothetical protein GCM10010109_52010 [Actinoplanes campanulatus]GID41351.1 hypothetical protein Aca09nite_78570 [Actinoplanes campanulatus]
MSTHTLIRVDETVDRAAVTELSRRPEAPTSGVPIGPPMASGDPLMLLLSAPRPKRAR